MPEAGENTNPGAAGSDGNQNDGTEIRIGDKVFKGANAEKEAREFAVSENQRLSAEKEIAEAYRAGVQDASQLPPGQRPVVPAEKTPEQLAAEKKAWEEKFYSDPAAVLEEEKRKIAVQLTSELEQRNALKQNEEKLWAEFFKDHPDLVGFEDDAQGVVTKFQSEIRALNQTKGKKEGFNFIAQKVRAKFQAYVDAQKPRTDLSNGKGGPSGGTHDQAGGGSGRSESVTTQKPDGKSVDFVSQIRNLRKGKGLAG